MGIIKVLVYVCLITCFTVYIHFEKRNSYQKGFSDGVKHYSDLVEEVLHRTNQWNKEMEDAGMNLTAYIESIKPLNKAESKGDLYL